MDGALSVGLSRTYGIGVSGADGGAMPGMLLHKDDRLFHGLHGEGMDLVLRHEARADLVADEVGEPLPLTLQLSGAKTSLAVMTELFDPSAEVGCYTVSLGIETGAIRLSETCKSVNRL